MLKYRTGILNPLHLTIYRNTNELNRYFVLVEGRVYFAKYHMQIGKIRIKMFHCFIYCSKLFIIHWESLSFFNNLDQDPVYIKFQLDRINSLPCNGFRRISLSYISVYYDNWATDKGIAIPRFMQKMPSIICETKWLRNGLIFWKEDPVSIITVRIIFINIFYGSLFSKKL